MIIYPALDLRGGKVVRLRQGDPAQQRIYGSDPVEVAQRWIAAGAEWLHVVNLDGTLGEANNNEQVVSRLAQLGVPIQFGGGIRSLESIRRALDFGVRRVVLGTLAVEQPAIVTEAIGKWGAEAISVALDSRDGKVTTRGWQQVTAVPTVELATQMAQQGARHALYTDVSRDGELTGVNVDATVELARASGLQVIASGGVSSIQDIVALHKSGLVAGAILGTALYEGMVDLAEAIQLARRK